MVGNAFSVGVLSIVGNGGGGRDSEGSASGTLVGDDGRLARDGGGEAVARVGRAEPVEKGDEGLMASIEMTR